MNPSYDAIVIGAGVMGASIAFHLAERGLRPCILERKVTASGATGHYQARATGNGTDGITTSMTVTMSSALDSAAAFTYAGF